MTSSSSIPDDTGKRRRVSGAQSSCGGSKMLQTDPDPCAAAETDGLHQATDKSPKLCKRLGCIAAHMHVWQVLLAGTYKLLCLLLAS